jgi:hypothetical protein
MKVALDIATKTGWCTETAYGTWDKNRIVGRAEREVVRFKSKVREMIAMEGIT